MRIPVPCEPRPDITVVRLRSLPSVAALRESGLFSNDECDGVATRAREASAGVLRPLLESPRTLAVSVRFVCKPATGALTGCVVHRAKSAAGSPAGSGSAAASLARILDQAATLCPRDTLEPLDASIGRDTFVASDAVEFTQADELFNIAPGNTACVVTPLWPSESALESILLALVKQGASSFFAVNAVPTTLRSPEDEKLGLLVSSAQRIHQKTQYTYVREGFVALDMAQLYARYRELLSRGCALVNVMVASEAPIAEAFLRQVEAELFQDFELERGHVKRNRACVRRPSKADERVSAIAQLARVEVQPWGERQARPPLERLPYLVDFDTLLHMLRLPVLESRVAGIGEHLPAEAAQVLEERRAKEATSKTVVNIAGDMVVGQKAVDRRHIETVHGNKTVGGTHVHDSIVQRSQIGGAAAETPAAASELPAEASGGSRVELACGHLAGRNAKRCAECGKEARVLCPRCQRAGASRFCEDCGTSLR